MEEIISFEPPFTGVSGTTGRRLKITGYLSTYPPQFRCLDGDTEIMTTGEDIMIDDEQLFPPTKPMPPKTKVRKLSETFKKKIRERLNQEAKRIKKERELAIGKLKATLRENARSRGGNNPADTNDDAASDVLNNRIKNCAKRLWKIGLALVWLEINLYGLYKNCGEEIPLERLNEIPHADTCVNCKGAGHRGHRSNRPRTHTLAPRAAH